MQKTKNKQNKKISNKTIIAIIVVVMSIFIFFNAITNNNSSRTKIDESINNQIKSEKTHISRDLRIKFKYPKDWFIDDRYGMILLANYKTDLNKKSIKKLGNVVINIFNEELCDMSMDEQVRIGGCYAEGNWRPTEIIDKQISELSSGGFYKYTIKHPQGEKQIIYYLQNGNKMLKISKEPDPSEFDQEFEDIIRSIQFL